MRSNKAIIGIVATLVLGTLPTGLRADQAHCVTLAAGSATDAATGSIQILGQSAIGTTLGGMRVVDAGAIHCYVNGAPGGLLGDMNCDGAVTVGDINPFVLALTDPVGYAAAFPDCNLLNGDCTDDGALTVGDINCFVELVTGG